jgi:hypothetical protein
MHGQWFVHGETSKFFRKGVQYSACGELIAGDNTGSPPDLNLPFAKK